MTFAMRLRAALAAAALIGAATIGIGLAQAALGGRDALDRIVGNTLVATVEPKLEVAVFFDKGGTVRGSQGADPVSGTWRLDGDRLCLTKGEQRTPDCYDLAVAGQEATLTSSMDIVHAKILPGNPRNF